MNEPNIRKTITQNLNYLLESKKIRPVDFAAELGVSKSAVSHWLAGDNSPNVEILARICIKYELNMSDLLGEDFSFSFEEKETIKKYRILDRYGKKAVNDLLETEYYRCTEIDDYSNIITLPKAELKASAGTGQWLGDDEYKTWIHVVDTPEARKSNVVIEIDGDSMEPIFHDGDMALVKLQPSIDIGDIGIFIVDNCGFIKKLGFNELISINELYDNIPLHEFENVKCVGKVLGKAIVR